MSRWIAKIVISKAIYSIDAPYDYFIPPELVPTLQVGMRVLVPFGAGNRGSEGLVLSVLELVHSEQVLKSVVALLDEAPVLSQEGVQLVIWMREHYYCTAFECARTMLPTGLFFALQDHVTLTCSPEEALLKSHALSSSAQQLVEYLVQWEGTGEMKQIRMAFGTKDPNPAIRSLINESIATLKNSAKKSGGDKSDKIVALTLSPEDAMAHVTPQRGRSPVRYAVVELLCQVGQASAKELSYYTGSTSSTIKSLEKSGLIEVFSKEVLRTPHVEDVPPAPPPVLNPEQAQVLQGLLDLRQNTAAALLYGVTGSGKTQVYLALIHQLLKEGRTALVLIPEISLTPQFLRIFTAQFGSDIAILHSGLRIGERYDEWKRVKRGDAKVVLGTRSAVFAPLENIGVIIIDEEQETSYKSDRSPRYHARDIAKFRCVKHNALLLLGSATPSLDSMYRAKAGIYHLFTLTTRFNQGDLPPVTIVDMKEELRDANTSSISGHLLHELNQNIGHKEQAILFLNRRGSNSMVTCGECGSIPECPNCALRLTFHSANNRLMCHYCGFNYVLPEDCPECHSRFVFIGVGTQQVQEDLQKLLPTHTILRMDADTISAVHTHEHLLQQFQQENIPVLVGTQMVAKGLDFENVTLVGVIAGDVSLYMDDIFAGERTFSLITQVVGRAGRGGKKGRAIIQTFTPEHDVIRTAAQQDYDQFYAQEIELRRLQNYPPFRDMFLIAASGAREIHVLEALNKIRKGLEYGATHSLRECITILGPAPAPIPKINNRFRFRITVMGRNTKSLRGLFSQLLTAAQKDKANKAVSIYIDHLG